MKQKFLLFAAFQLLLLSLAAQDTAYISPRAYHKMMNDFFNFTLVGSQTPTSGIKVETSKPSISLKGNIFSQDYRRFVINLELEGGLDNGFMQLVAGKQVSSYFKGVVGFNWLLPNTKAKRYTLTDTEHQLTYHARYRHAMTTYQQIDTFVTIEIITDEDWFGGLNFAAFARSVRDRRNLSIYHIDDAARDYPDGIDSFYHRVIRAVLHRYGGKVTSDSTQPTLSDDNLLLNDFRKSLREPDSTRIRSKELLDDYDRLHHLLMKEPYTIKDKQCDFEIALTKFNWTRKTIQWVNASISAGNTNFKLFHPATEAITDSFSFAPGITLSYNLLTKGKEPKRFSYFRGGIGFTKTNSLADLSKFSYRKENAIQASATETLTDTKEGIAYIGDLVEKVAFDAFAEGYIVPWKSAFIPGFHFRTMYRNSDAWINKKKLVLDLGIIWNIASNEKDAKNLLSIVPYVSWSNLLREYKDNAKLQEKSLGEKFMFGVKIGVPVNIGK